MQLPLPLRCTWKLLYRKLTSLAFFIRLLGGLSKSPKEGEKFNDQEVVWLIAAKNCFKAEPRVFSGMMMKVVSFCVRLSLIGVALINSNGFSGGFGRSIPVSGRMISEEVMTEQATSRNLKGNEHPSGFKGASNGRHVILEDYRPFDPSPSSKAKVKPGPIEHGTPLMPFIPNPKPSPPKPSSPDDLA